MLRTPFQNRDFQHLRESWSSTPNRTETEQINRRIGVYILGILIIGLIVRLAIIDISAVNTDDGMWIYDSWQILQGRTPIVDFPSRSPLYHYLLTALWAIEPVTGAIIAGRLIQIFVGVITALLVYALAREVAGTNTALVALALYWWSAPALGYGMHIKTEVLAGGIVVLAVLLAYRCRSYPVSAPIALGMLLSVGYLIRRSVIVVLGALFIYFLLTRQYRAAGIMPPVWVAGLSAGYLALGGSPEMGYAVANQHLFDLVLDRGFGGTEWVAFSEGFADHVTGRDRSVMLRISAARIEVVGHLLAVHVALMTVWARAWIDRFDAGRYAIGGLLSIGLSGIILHTIFLRPIRLLGAVLLITVAISLWQFDALEFDALRLPGTPLIWLLLGAISVAYLARNRVIYGPYVLDVLPLISVVAAIAAVELYRSQPGLSRRHAVIGAAVLIATTPMVAPVHHGLSGAYYTPSDIRELGAGVDETGADQVLTAQPLYVIESDAEISAHFVRKFYIVREAPSSPLADEVAAELAAEACRADLVIWEGTLELVIERSPELVEAVKDCNAPGPTPDRARDGTVFWYPS